MFGPEWCAPEAKPKPRKVKRPRRREPVPAWLVSLLACPKCNRPRVMAAGREALYVACPFPGCSKLWPRKAAEEAIKLRRAELVKNRNAVPEPDKCVRVALRYLRNNAKATK